MFLHELSRAISKDWVLRVDQEQYGELVRQYFSNRCPYCLIDLTNSTAIVEHLDGMNRYRAGLHVVGNVLVACRKCNSEKRRDDSLKALTLASSGWASFLSHDGMACASGCKTCRYWESVWVDPGERKKKLTENLQRIIQFRAIFPEFQLALPTLAQALPISLTKLYSDCQIFAETEIKTLLLNFIAASENQS